MESPSPLVGIPTHEKGPARKKRVQDDEGSSLRMKKELQEEEDEEELKLERVEREPGKVSILTKLMLIRSLQIAPTDKVNDLLSYCEKKYPHLTDIRGSKVEIHLNKIDTHFLVDLNERFHLNIKPKFIYD